eukprot:357326-Chlamydomonas_euryale.AAC.2
MSMVLQNPASVSSGGSRLTLPVRRPTPLWPPNPATRMTCPVADGRIGHQVMGGVEVWRCGSAAYAHRFFACFLLAISRLRDALQRHECVSLRGMVGRSLARSRKRCVRADHPYNMLRRACTGSHVYRLQPPPRLNCHQLRWKPVLGRKETEIERCPALQGIRPQNGLCAWQEQQLTLCQANDCGRDPYHDSAVDRDYNSCFGCHGQRLRASQMCKYDQDVGTFDTLCNAARSLPKPQLHHIYA